MSPLTCGICREQIVPWGDGYRHVYGDNDHDAALASEEED